MSSIIIHDYPANVQAAIDWWGKAVRYPKYDNGDKAAAIIAMLSESSSMDNNINYDDEIEKFKDMLAKYIMEELEEKGSCTLAVDYDPCLILSNASRYRRGIRFPWKTWMSITEDKVEVSHGRRAPVQTIWDKEKDLEPEQPGVYIKR